MEKHDIHFEVMVRQNGRWEIHARYPKTKQDIAVRDAQSLESISTIEEVRVVRESYDSNSGMSVEATVYPKPKDKPRAPKKTASQPKPKKIVRKKSAPATPSPKNGKKNKPEKEPGENKKNTSLGGLFLKLFFAVMVSIVIALVTMAMTIPFLQDMKFSPSVYKGLLTGVFAVVFTASIVFFGKSILSRTLIVSSHKKDSSSPPPKNPPQQPPPPEPEKTRQDDLSPAAVTSILLTSAAEQGVTMATKDFHLIKGRKKPSDLTQLGQKNLEFINSYLDASLNKAGVEKEKMDNFNKFGLNLFLAGGNEAIGEKHSLDGRTQSQILAESVQGVGFSKLQAQSFADKYEDYLLSDSRYMQMFQAGRIAMNTQLSGDPEAVKHLDNALKQWNSNKAKEETTGPVTVVFTDMVGSTALTQTMGDEVAQQVVRAHNRIVRDALTRFAGKEIKHTGDGIMASFSNTSKGVEASIDMQENVRHHNINNPDLPLHIKIGINAGEPIVEENDLFGTTVQLSARIVDKAKREQIFVSETVHGICAGKDFTFLGHGNFAMKGFETDQRLYEVVWDKDALEKAKKEKAGKKEKKNKAEKNQGAEQPPLETQSEETSPGKAPLPEPKPDGESPPPPAANKP